MTRYVFVYGTLKRGFYNHILLENSEFIGDVVTKNKYPMVNVEEHFPYLINDIGIGHNIIGELFKINDETFTKLDILEGYPDLYTRETIKVISFGIEISAIAYFVKETIEYTNLELMEEYY